MQQVSISKILAPIDFSKRTESATGTAKRLAAHYGAELMLLHVVEPFHLDFAMVQPFDGSLQELARANRAKKQAQLDSFALSELKGVRVTRMIVEGDPASRILERSVADHADLVVMSTQGHSRLRGMLIGSVTAKVLDASECPVLTGTHLEPDDDAADWQIRHILCAVDLGARTGAVLGWCAALAKEFQANVTALHVSSDSRAASRLAKAVEAAGLTASQLTAEGEAHKVVTVTAAHLKADLVVIGRGTATSTLGRLRAQAYAIVRQAPCPVLSV